MSRWDATSYDDDFGFVTSLGRHVLTLLDPQPGERILDLGCGTGHHCADLAAHGCRVVGVDGDEDMIRRARSLYALQGDLAFVVADAQDPAIVSAVGGNGAFDAVVSNAALHWMTDVDAVLANVRATLREGGRFVAELGGAGNVRRTRDALAAALVDLGVDAPAAEASVSARSWFPTIGQQATALEAAGFEVVLAEVFERPTRLPAGTTVADWAAMFRPWLADALAPEQGETLRVRIDLQARLQGLQHLDDTWWVDYVRLRFIAVAR